MTHRLVYLIMALVFTSTVGYSATDDEETVSGWSFGGVPAIAYNSDTGFKYGAVVNLYNYGDGSTYPDYLYSIYLEWTRTTKGSGQNIIFFDSEYLMPADIRITSELSYRTEQALPFYGFNGYQTQYHPDWEDEDDPAYRSRVFYRHERNVGRFMVDFQRKLLTDNLRWIAGTGYWNTNVASVDLEELNEGKPDDEQLPNIREFYDRYVDMGYITDAETHGGNTNYLKAGLVYDSRDNEPNPMRGIWTDLMLTAVPEFLFNDFSYTTLTLTHRQYFTIIPEDLSFAYRVGYQSVIGGDIPFFMLPFYQSSYKIEEGLGGAKSLRGILKNRIVGNSIGFTNLELRWKFYRGKLFGQNLYLALNGFVDAGRSFGEYGNSVYQNTHDPYREESPHISYGGGFRIALNENFIVAADYGIAADPQDGTSGLYISLGYLF
ncbi:MAG: outer membrane protein assembly factor [Candidatus Marinimicrobia bacterium]|nr:outer membrane protein assembly factor [Candidatus Neomarinimicrobiota bacterium]MCF7829673.1 outer membrane protein assembly factor [Candidatus Neomarinimicrobiota bacterium]MCF7879833.1 outer membrane protein assembly factor [Candidatus Neomarinimicrobiota bacterium]